MSDKGTQHLQHRTKWLGLITSKTPIPLIEPQITSEWLNTVKHAP